MSEVFLSDNPVLQKVKIVKPVSMERKYKSAISQCRSQKFPLSFPQCSSTARLWQEGHTPAFAEDLDTGEQKNCLKIFFASQILSDNNRNQSSVFYGVVSFFNLQDLEHYGMKILFKKTIFL